MGKKSEIFGKLFLRLTGFHAVLSVASPLVHFTTKTENGSNSIAAQKFKENTDNTSNSGTKIISAEQVSERERTTRVYSREITRMISGYGDLDMLRLFCSTYVKISTPFFIGTQKAALPTVVKYFEAMKGQVMDKKVIKTETGFLVTVTQQVANPKVKMVTSDIKTVTVEVKLDEETGKIIEISERGVGEGFSLMFLPSLLFNGLVVQAYNKVKTAYDVTH